MTIQERINLIKIKILNYVKETDVYRSLPRLDNPFTYETGYNGVSYKYLAEYVCEEDQDLVNYVLVELGNDEILGFTLCGAIRGLSFNRYEGYGPTWYLNSDKYDAFKKSCSLLYEIEQQRKKFSSPDYKICYENQLIALFESYDKVKTLLEKESKIKLQNKPEMSLS